MINNPLASLLNQLLRQLFDQKRKNIYSLQKRSHKLTVKLYHSANLLLSFHFLSLAPTEDSHRLFVPNFF